MTTSTTTTSKGKVSKEKKNKRKSSFRLRKSHLIKYPPKRNGRRKVQILKQESGEFCVRLKDRTTKHPIVNDYEKARKILDDFTETGFIGVQQEGGEESSYKYSPYFILNGEIIPIERTFDTAKEAAECHDEHAKENGVKYSLNLLRSRAAPNPFTSRNKFAWKIRLSPSDFEYKVQNREYYFAKNNVRLLRFFALRLVQQQDDDDGRNNKEEVWRCLEQIFKLVSAWMTSYFDSSHDHPYEFVYEISETLLVAWKVGDQLLSKEAIISSKTKKIKNRLNYSKGIFQIISKALVIVKHPKKQMKVQPIFYWVLQLLRFQGYLIMEELKDDREIEKLKQDYWNVLESLSSHEFWGKQSGFIQLQGEFIYQNCVQQQQDIHFSSKKDQMTHAQNLFLDAVKFDSLNSRAISSLAISEYELKNISASIGHTSLLSISQRTTQYDNEDEEDDDEEVERRDKEAIVSTKKEDAIETILNICKENPSLPNLYVLEFLLFQEDENDDDDKRIKQKRKCLIDILKLEPTLKGLTLSRISLLWKLSSHEQQHYLEFFNVLISCMEYLTQKECISYTTNYYSPKCIPLWEYAVACIQKIQFTNELIVFNEEQTTFWCRRFFPDLIGYFQDPFDFYKGESLIEEQGRSIKKTKITQQDEQVLIKDGRYLLGLKAYFALKTNLSKDFYHEALQILHDDEEEYVELCVKTACNVVN